MVKVIPTTDTWFGVTYKEDKPMAVAAIAKQIERVFILHLVGLNTSSNYFIFSSIISHVAVVVLDANN